MLACGSSFSRVTALPSKPRAPHSESKGYATPHRFFGESARGSFFSEKAALSHHPNSTSVTSITQKPASSA